MTSFGRDIRRRESFTEMCDHFEFSSRRDEQKKAAMGIIGPIGTLMKEPVGNASMWLQTAMAPPPTANNWEQPSTSGAQVPNQFTPEASNIRRPDQSHFDSRRQDVGPWQGRSGRENNFDRNYSEPIRPYWGTANESPAQADQPEILPRDSRLLGSRRPDNFQVPPESGPPNIFGDTPENNQPHNMPSSYNPHTNRSLSQSNSSSGSLAFPVSAQTSRFGPTEPVDDWNRLPLPNQGVRPGNWSGRGRGFSQPAPTDRFQQDGGARGGTKRHFAADDESFDHSGGGGEAKWQPNQPVVPRPTTSDSGTPDYEALTQYLSFYQRQMSAIQRRGAN